MSVTALVLLLTCGVLGVGSVVLIEARQARSRRARLDSFDDVPPPRVSKPGEPTDFDD